MRSFLGLMSLVIGWLLFWTATIATTCTQCDTDSIVAASWFSTPFYLASWLTLRPTRMLGRQTLLAVIFTPPLLYQMYIAARVTYAAVIQRGCACWAYEDFPLEWMVEPSMPVMLAGPILFLTAAISAGQILSGVLRKMGVQKPSAS